ncbi:TonB-dependent receptor [Colwellia sp. 1_MG-2023]|uniref:TonB-dependent receptor n=1 Tax=unclassified Colwellia TaxID=196834 RepID=UPI001C099D12|nr:MULTISPECIES: TonB-dependent receptor [unclassified Colwellia]MBU2924436.1 TonB-dependent receptor [Colwellia sp. C2M11]MDO6653096.1 TonB-dependent receptor [Colwellia sp. 3_MG-2023]MDO6665917.1 TonB-dependent receptor [Colwellia sp. 2_MG-2023]MDO6690290.1 TonB-dependent receptor [Colwellia sp. 1_MG-2023]
MKNIITTRKTKLAATVQQLFTGKSIRNNLSVACLGLALPFAAVAADEPANGVQKEAEIEVISVTGMRGSLTSALAQKRDTDNLTEVIMATDIGKLPDQNLAEVLENVTGIQITRTAGIGTGVQIRGSNANRVEINGASTVGSGAGRNGMNFEDLSAAIIAGVEITKAPEAKTTEGSIGGTINLRTIRPLELTETLGSLRVQGEDSSLTTDGVQPRISGAYGDNWQLDSGGKVGFVVSGSFTKQEATSFRPRVDRDGGLVENASADVYRGFGDDRQLENVATDRPVAQNFDFLGIQFLNQELENFEYETTNLATTFEYAPNDNMKFFVDAIITSQERRQESTRVQASGVGSVLNYNLPDTFETVNFGSLDGVNLGSIQAATTGTIQPFLNVHDSDPNLRFNSDTGARVTDTEVFRIGGEWQDDNLFISAEVSYASSETSTPSLNSQLNFINPNTPLSDLDADGNITSDTDNDNAVPFAYDLTGNSLAFGIDFDSPFAPSVDDLLDYNNVVLDQVDISQNTNENSDTAFRVDSTYYIDDNIVTSVDFGYRYNKTKHSAVTISDRIGGFSKMIDSPNGALFQELLVPGPSHFGDADGRELALRNFLIIDPDRAFNDPDGVIEILEQAMLENAAVTGGSPSLPDLTPSDTAAFDIEEESHALYAQANFEYEMIRGNFGVRHVSTDIASTGNTVSNNVVTPVTTTADYSYTLPRLNLVADVTDDVVVRLGWGKDILRPNFGDLNTSVSFGTNENQALELGNAGLEPEEVTSFDISAEWYFAEAAVVSIGYFKKDRTNLFVTALDSAALDGNGLRDTNPACSGGGIWNPSVQPNVLGDPDTEGLCVDRQSKFNDSATVTQSGIELAFQYDLSSFEDDLGWASGFGVVANYTIQDYSGGSAKFTSATRGTDIFNAINGIYDDQEFVTYSSAQGLPDFSENAYNFTVYYEKYGLSARLRYTWREAYRTEDTAAGASLNSTLGFPVVTHDRGQLNASISYDVNDQLNLGVEAVNLTESDITQSCVNEGALLCAQGITDRRITFGASYRF